MSKRAHLPEQNFWKRQHDEIKRQFDLEPLRRMSQAAKLTWRNIPVYQAFVDSKKYRAVAKCMACTQWLYVYGGELCHREGTGIMGLWSRWCRYPATMSYAQEIGMFSATGVKHEPGELVGYSLEGADPKWIGEMFEHTPWTPEAWADQDSDPPPAWRYR